MKTKNKNYKRDCSQRTEFTAKFPITGKNSGDISSYIYKSLRYFKTVMYLFQYFSRNPKRCSVEPKSSAETCLRNTLLSRNMVSEDKADMAQS